MSCFCLLTCVHTICESEISVWVFVTLEKLHLLYWNMTDMNQTVAHPAGDVSLNYTYMPVFFFSESAELKQFFRFLIRFRIRVRFYLIDKRDGYRFGLVRNLLSFQKKM